MCVSCDSVLQLTATRVMRRSYHQHHNQKVKSSAIFNWFHGMMWIREFETSENHEAKLFEYRAVMKTLDFRVNKLEDSLAESESKRLEAQDALEALKNGESVMLAESKARALRMLRHVVWRLRGSKMSSAITSWFVRTHAAMEADHDAKEKDYEFMLAREADEWELAIRAQKAVASRLMEQLARRVGGHNMEQLIFTWHSNLLIQKAGNRQDLAAEITNLQQQLATLTITNKNETEARKAAENQLSPLRAELSGNKKQLQQNAQQISDLESQLVQAKALLRAMEHKRERDTQNQKDLDGLRDQLRDLNIQMEKMSQEHLGLELQLRKRISTVEGQRKKMRDEREHMLIHSRRVMQVLTTEASSTDLDMCVCRQCCGPDCWIVPGGGSGCKLLDRSTTGEITAGSLLTEGGCFIK